MRVFHGTSADHYPARPGIVEGQSGQMPHPATGSGWPVLYLIIAFFLTSCSPEIEERPLTVFAAASLVSVLPDLGEAWAAETGNPAPVFSFGPSGTLARQIALGAPADMFISANQDWTSWLSEKSPDISKSAPTKIAGNQLVLVAGPGQDHHPEVIVSQIAAALPGHSLAIADPAISPLGLYSDVALNSLGVDRSKSALIQARDARLTLRLVEQGAADMGIVYRTDASMSGKVRILSEIPQPAHGEIAYRSIQLGEGPVADFQTWLTGPQARLIWLQNGFTTPD